MKKLWTVIFWLFVIFACGGTLWQFSQSAAFQKMNEPIAPSILPQSSPRAVGPALSTATETPVPTATQDYGATSTAYKAELDNANAQVMDAQSKANSALSTALYYSNVGIQVTLSANEIILNSQHMTSTQAEWIRQNPTPTPQWTVTAEYIQANIIIAQALKTHDETLKNEPQRIMQVAQANRDANFGWVGDALLFVGLIIILVTIILVYKIVMAKDAGRWADKPFEQSEPEWMNNFKESINTEVKINDETAYPSAKWLELPCTQNQFMELAEKVVVNHLSLSFNPNEGSQSGLTRTIMNRVRWWAVQNEFAAFVPIPNSNPPAYTCEPNEAGKRFFEAFYARGTLPHLFTFNPEFEIPREKNSHAHEHETPKDSVGEVVLPDFHPITQKGTR